MGTKPNFSGYPIVGDETRWHFAGFDLVARIEHDPDTTPKDFECYTAEDVASWYYDEWEFVGMVIDVYYRGVKLAEHAASLWGIALHLRSSSSEDRRHLNEVASDLQSDAISAAMETLDKLRAA